MAELCNDASRRVFLAAFMLLGLSLFSSTTEADLVADYRFDGTLSSSVPGAPDLADLGTGNYASGQALLNGPLQKENAYAALRVDRTKYYALAHEIGHLFGAAHDRYSITYPDTGQGAALPGSHYGFVHIDDENSFNTIMASALGCKNQLPAVRCIRKNLFSNPDRLINGLTPAGTSNDNNADQITSAAPTVACYYNRS